MADNKPKWSNMVFLLRADGWNTEQTAFNRAVKPFDAGTGAVWLIFMLITWKPFNCNLQGGKWWWSSLKWLVCLHIQERLDLPSAHDAPASIQRVQTSYSAELQSHQDTAKLHDCVQQEVPFITHEEERTQVRLKKDEVLVSNVEAQQKWFVQTGEQVNGVVTSDSRDRGTVNRDKKKQSIIKENAVNLQHLLLSISYILFVTY